MSGERRKYERINVKVHMRGVMTLPSGDADFVAHTLNLTRDGALVQLSDDTFARVTGAMEKTEELKGAVLNVTLISYIESNFSLRGVVTFVKRTADKICVGVQFESLGADDLTALEGIIEKRLDLAGDGDITKEEYRFGSMAEFFREVTTFTMLVGKTEKFWIGGHRFTFVGMHMSETGELHKDCIAPVKNPNRVYCPDCRDHINSGSMI